MFSTKKSVAALGLAFAIVAPSAFAQAEPAPRRFPQITLEQLDPQARLLGEEIMRISSVGLGGPYNPMLRSPSTTRRLLLYFRLQIETNFYRHQT
jgi:4-carboxymuconolactone decarboxylase